MTQYDTSPLARVLTDAGTFRDAPFTLMDVGCSGGLIEIGNAFSPDLRAVGFDPLSTEIERLKASEKRAGVEYEATLVGAGEAEVGSPRKTPGVFTRSSAAAYSRLHGFDYQRAYFNSSEDIQATDRVVRLDEWLAGRPDWRVDFLKVDTDGADLDVLLSLGNRLDEPLAIHAEVLFDGDPGPTHNVFSTIFDLVAGAGFRLFSLTPTMYAREAFPQPFARDLPAQTVRGQVMQADALFCRDLAVEGDDDPVRILKLASIFDLMDLQDCAAELIEVHADAVRAAGGATGDDIARALAGGTPLGMTPAESRQVFGATPSVFFPTRDESGRLVPAGARDADGQARPPVIVPGGAEVQIGTGDGRTTSALGTGWFAPEESGAWTCRPHATLSMDFTETAPRGLLEMDYSRLDADGAGRTLAVSLNGEMLPTVPGTPEGVARFLMPRQPELGVSVLTIYAWPLLRPADVFGSPDERMLGIWVSAVRLMSAHGPDEPPA